MEKAKLIEKLKNHLYVLDSTNVFMPGKDVWLSKDELDLILTSLTAPVPIQERKYFVASPDVIKKYGIPDEDGIVNKAMQEYAQQFIDWHLKEVKEATAPVPDGKEEIKLLKEKIKKLEFMIDNGLGWKDMQNDITNP